MTTLSARLSKNLFIWHRYDVSVKAELFSTALVTADGVVAIDPIEMSRETRAEFESLGCVISVLVSNANHARAAAAFADRSGTAIFAPMELRETLPAAKFWNGLRQISGLDILPIEGAAPGEVAFHDARDGGTLIFGDALINFGSDGFSLLPRKYCGNQPRMLKSLRQLLTLDCERILFAHGEPLVTRAQERFAALLENV